ncbi:LOW QUALITY PROTEIN: hypothetical protein Cgig2_027581 [Carnegiea gigantea]|uniref:Uncharacterized protein n=1 Tax=Carnegiea gigantea TaxID=171969 RepID=A0A9Q1GTH7_9CARY|nr:LOW QUALITY PROTEIN: hypothetical protein Cgig2_027581 [Carnegiea gigantea]
MSLAKGSSFDFKCRKYWGACYFLSFLVESFSPTISDKTKHLHKDLFNGKRLKDLSSTNSVRIHLPRFRASLGWLAETFPTLYSQRPDSECPRKHSMLLRLLQKWKNWWISNDSVFYLPKILLTRLKLLIWKTNLKGLSSEALRLKLRENEILMEEEWIHKMRKDLML